MNTMSGFDYFEVPFTKEGSIGDASVEDQVKVYLAQQQPSDLLVISHGWLTDQEGARGLYTKVFDQFRTVLDQGVVSGLLSRQFAILGVIWPSKKYSGDGQISGGAAGLDSGMEQALEAQLTDLADLLAEETAMSKISELKGLIPQLEDETSAQKFADGVCGLLDQGVGDEEDGTSALFSLSGNEIMQNLSLPIGAPPTASGEGGAADLGGDLGSSEGGAAGLLFPGGFLGAASALLNLATYYEMKRRAGIVGCNGLNPLLQRLKQMSPDLKIHLIGHSFGGRLVTAAARGTGSQPLLHVQTLSLLQTAFSHFGFAKQFMGNKDGFFRPVVDNHCVSGCTLVTHTKNDKAVGIAYPIASALSKENAAGLGDADDQYGAIGSNGALKTPESIDGMALQPVGHPYTFTAGKIHNLLADAYIKSHGDIGRPEVAYAILSAVADT
jgi:hypothetical protein